MAENNKGESRGEMQAARIKAWEKGAHRFINHGQPTPHTAWINGFNTGFADGYTAAQTDAARSPDSVRQSKPVIPLSDLEAPCDECARLTRQLETARTALEHYADEKNWDGVEVIGNIYENPELLEYDSIVKQLDVSVEEVAIGRSLDRRKTK